MDYENSHDHTDHADHTDHKAPGCCGGCKNATGGGCKSIRMDLDLARPDRAAATAPRRDGAALSASLQ